MYYARYNIEYVTDLDLAWWKEVFDTRAELEVLSSSHEISYIGAKFQYTGRSSVNAHFHSKDDALIFLIRFPSAILEAEEYDV